MKQDTLIEALRSGSEDAIRQLYRLYRKEFLHWAIRTYNCREEEALDAFQETVIILYEKIQGNEEFQLQSQLKTYLFGVAKKRLNKQYSKELVLEESTAQFLVGLEEDKLEASDQVQQLANLVAKMKPPCDQVLFLYYYRSFTMESIANDLGYSSPDVAKTQKNRCLKKLRTSAKEIL